MLLNAKYESLAQKFRLYPIIKYRPNGCDQDLRILSFLLFH